MLLEEGAEEQTEVLDEVLFVVFAIGIGQTDICVQGQHLKGKKTHITYVGTKCECFTTIDPAVWLVCATTSVNQRVRPLCNSYQQ